MEDHQTTAEIKEEVVDCGSAEADQVKTEVEDIHFVEVDSHGVHQLCTACLCAARTIHTLGDVTLKQYYMNILAETQLEVGAHVLQSPRLCWECVAHLKRLVRFREQVQDSYRLLQTMLLTCEYEDVDELLRSSVCRPGRLNTCFAHSVDIAPRDEELLVMTADHDDDDDGVEQLLMPVKEETNVKTEAEATERSDTTIETRCSTLRETVATVIDCVEEHLDELPAMRNYRAHVSNDELIEETDARTRKPVGKHVKKIVRFQCEVCHKSFARKRCLIRHIRTHTGEKPFQCKICLKSFAEKDVLIKHKRTHTGEKPFQCYVCHKLFSQVSHLIVHRRTHTDEKQFVCEMCPKSFTLKNTLIKHIRTHTGEKPFQCTICPKSFAEKAVLIQHKRTHTGEKPFQCEVCHRLFSHLCNLSRHRRSHTGEKPFHCDTCSKSFAEKITLIRHRKTHIGQKPFQCEMCPKSFAEKNTLIRHKITHTGEKPFQCDMCPKSFAQKSILMRHKRTHTGEKPFQCEVCYKLFSHLFNLIRHRRTHAGEKRVSQ